MKQSFLVFHVVFQNKLKYANPLPPPAKPSKKSQLVRNFDGGTVKGENRLHLGRWPEHLHHEITFEKGKGSTAIHEILHSY